MKRKLLVNIQEFFSKFSKKPWACFETEGPNKEGILEFSISWNKAFVDNLKSQGFHAMNDEELVQTFFISMRMIPEQMMADLDTINPEATPNLTSEANTLRR